MRIAELLAFREARFVLTPAMPVELRTAVCEAHKAGAPLDTLALKIVEHYDTHTTLLNELVNRLCAAPEMVDREKVLQQTLEAHRAHYDAMTVYALLPIIEGITIQAPNTIFPMKEKKGKKIVLPINKMSRELGNLTLKRLPTGVRHAARLLSLIAFAESHLYKSFNWTNEEERRAAMETLSRHTYLHGLIHHGSRADTLRCFLILDLIVAVMRDIPPGTP